MNIFSKFFQKNATIENTNLSKNNIKKSIPLKIDHEDKNDIPFINDLTDTELEEFNALLDWNCYILDKNGRRFGNIAWSGKRMGPQTVNDYRHKILNDRIPLANKAVLEIGCFEGIHTINLCRLSKSVTAIDSRIENIVKTIVRCAMFNYHPVVFKSDVENWLSQKELLKADVCHHVGVLYHLKDPVKHLIELSSFIGRAILLDTHYAKEEEAIEKYETLGKTYSYKKYAEGKDVFSGMYDHAKWLTLEILVEILKNSGFNNVEIIEKREERNGSRVLLYANK